MSPNSSANWRRCPLSRCAGPRMCSNGSRAWECEQSGPRSVGRRARARRRRRRSSASSRRAQRAAGHRHRFRARAARGSDPVHLPRSTAASAPRSPPRSSCIARAARCATWRKVLGLDAVRRAAVSARSCSGGMAASRCRARARGGLRADNPMLNGCCRWPASC